MLGVKIDYAVLYGRSINRFGYFPSITLGGAILKALFEEGLKPDINKFRISRILSLDKEGKSFDNVVLPIGYLPSLSSSLISSDELSDYRKQLRGWKVCYKDLPSVLDIVRGRNVNEIISSLREERKPPFHVDYSSFNLVPLPKKARKSEENNSGLYNALSLNIKSAYFLVDGLSIKDLNIALSYIEDLGLGADKSTSGTISISLENGSRSIGEVELNENGLYGVLLNDMIPREGEEFIGKYKLYDSFNPMFKKYYKFGFVEAFSLSKGSIKGRDIIKADGDERKIFPGKSIKIGVDLNV